MPLKNYGVLKGTPTHYRNSKTANNHYQIRIDTGDDAFRIAVNVRSKLTPKDLLYRILPDFKHPITDIIEKVPFGFSNLDTRSGSGALDYLRGNLFNMEDMKVIPDDAPGVDNDLNDIFDFYIKKAIKEKGVVYAFGERWFPAEPGKKDKYFKENTPDQGIHDIHMNQGNSGSFAKDNGIWQDGGILIHYPQSDTWVAVFLRFQSQAIPTDEKGNPTPGPVPPTPTPTISRGPIRIIAAFVNPSGEENGKEKVLLFNRTNQRIDLKNWEITNNAGRKMTIDVQMEPGETKQIDMPATFQLSNKGGIISLNNAAGVKVDGVQYTKNDVKEEDFWVVF